MFLQDSGGHLATEWCCLFRSIKPSPMNGPSRIQLILTYFCIGFCLCVIGFHYVEEINMYPTHKKHGVQRTLYQLPHFVD